MTRLLQDILREPAELNGILEHTLGSGRDALDSAAALVRNSRQIVLTGIGASWHAGMAALSLFDRAGRPARLVDASELEHFVSVPSDSVVVALSRSGKSIEIVRMLDRVKNVIAITNAPESPLAQRADITLNLNAAFDHGISVTMYSGPALVAGLVAAASLGEIGGLGSSLAKAIEETQSKLWSWRQSIHGDPWFAKEAATVFLARGGSQASCHEARLLWEEAAKTSATALATGAFRHGPQEVIGPNLRVCVWIDAERMRAEDLALVRDLKSLGVRVMLIGQDVPAGESVFDLPRIPAPWQFLIDIVPLQLAAEHLAALRGADCDRFRHSAYVVESEWGLPASS